MRRIFKFVAVSAIFLSGFFSVHADEKSVAENDGTVLESVATESTETPLPAESNDESAEHESVKIKSHNYDESTSLFFFFSNMPRDDFKILLNLGTVQEKTIFEMVGFFGNFSTFTQIELDEMDASEKKMYEFALRNIIRKFKTNDVALGIIINEMDLIEGEFEGWGIVAHMVDRNDILSQVYYFTAEF